jgi:hypothetical protein
MSSTVATLLLAQVLSSLQRRGVRASAKATQSPQSTACSSQTHSRSGPIGSGFQVL